MTPPVKLVFTCTLGFFGALGYSQQPPIAPPLHPGDQPSILFAVEGELMERNAAGHMSSLPTLSPIAFLVNGEIRGCYSDQLHGSSRNNGEDQAIEQLIRAYTPPKHYPVWWRGTPWGQALAVKPCIDNSISMEGCFHLRPDPGQRAFPNGSLAISYTGSVSAPTHGLAHGGVNEKERTVFLEFASSAYARHHIHAASRGIHLEAIWKSQLQTGHDVLIGNTVFQYALKEKDVWASVRLVLAVEEIEGKYSAVLTEFHRSTINITAENPAPRPGAILRGESEYDVEEFVDNFPLFTGESDAIVTEHRYDEAAAYSIYRRRGDHYERVYTGCGGSE